jgi:hypothetical protein
MKRFGTAILCVVVSAIAVRAESDDLAKIDPVMGNWEGDWNDENSGGQGTCSSRIIGKGKTNYLSLFEAIVEGNAIPFEFDLKKETADSANEFEGKMNLGEDRGGEATYKFSIADGKLEGSVENDQVKVKIDMERVYNQPPTLGAKPPEGAVVLFDGTSVTNFTRTNGKENVWKLVDGAMQVKPGSGNIISKEKFLDHEIHLEFRTPYMPTASGQGRGNSGVYVGGNFEVQVLDSFGEPARDNEAGGIYEVAVPTENAALPPGEWQTYDITYIAPKTDNKGKITTAGEITVIYNGRKIHDKVKVEKLTKGGAGGDMGKPGPMLLQDHGNLVEYRNIWVKKLNGSAGN